MTNELNWLMGKNVKEINEMVQVYHVPVTLVPMYSGTTIVCYVLCDDETGKTYDCYFGGYGEGHFYMGLTQLDPID